MIRKFNIDEQRSEDLNRILGQLGFVYERTESRTRYALGSFMEAIASGDVTISNGGKSISIRFEIPQKN